MFCRPQISLLVPFRDSGEGRAAAWKWLHHFWSHHLRSAEIVMGRDTGSPFNKCVAVNDAARRARGRIFVILDADAYMNPAVIQQCADQIDAALKAKKRLWFMPYDKLYRLNRATTARLVRSNPRMPYCVPSPPPTSWLEDGYDPSGGHSCNYGHQYGAMAMVMPRRAFRKVGGMDCRFRWGWGCTDEKTEILTRSGWKSYKQVAVGDQVLTLNHETGLSEWNPIQKMNVYNDGPYKMLNIESKTHSSFTTMDHRWPVLKRRTDERIWRTTETLNSHDRIPLSAVCADLPVERTHDDALVELVAWFFTEGWVNSGRGGIAQSHVVHPENCASIESALNRAFGAPWVGRFPYSGKRGYVGSPSWNRRNNGRSANYCLNTDATAELLVHAPDKVPSHEFLLSLTQRQLDLFIKISMLGDGNTSKPGGLRQPVSTFEQRDPRAAEAFAFAALLSGRGVSIRQRAQNAKGDRSSGTARELDYAMTVARIRSRDRFSPFDGVHEVVDYDGPVWCPTTKNGTWLARREGSVYFTGNSEDASFLKALDTLYCQHEVARADILHLWHVRPGKNWETRKWMGQSFTPANSRLARRYALAAGESVWMQGLVDEHKPKRPFWRWNR